MGVKIRDDKPDGTIDVRKLTQGQLGVLVSPEAGKHTGAVVMRAHGESLVSLRDGDWWSTLDLNFRVRPIEPGTLLEIT